MVNTKPAIKYRTEKITLGGVDTWMNHYLQSNLDIILNEAIPYKWDCLFVLFGREGCGKTTLGTQCCKYLDEHFDITKTVFTPDQFIKACEDASVGSAILWDEAITGANVASHASKISTQIISQLTQIRKKKLKIFLCFPYLNLLNKYFVMRCTGGIYIYAKNYKSRGYAVFYDHIKLSILYGFMKEKYRYYPNGAIKICTKSFDFKFSKAFILPEEEYDDKKEKSRKDFLNGDSGSVNTVDGVIDSVCHHPPSSIRFNKTGHIWTCRRCGTTWNESPFKNNKGVTSKEGSKTTGKEGDVCEKKV